MSQSFSTCFSCYAKGAGCGVSRSRLRPKLLTRAETRLAGRPTLPLRLPLQRTNPPRDPVHQAREALAQLRFRLGRADGIVIVAQARAGDYANCDEAGSFGPDAVQYRPLGVDHFGRFGCRAASFVATCLLSLMYDHVRQSGSFQPLGT